MSFPTSPVNGQYAIVNNVNYVFSTSNNSWRRSPGVITLGSVKMFGSTSGDVTIKPAAVAGTATVFQLPATNGTNTYVLQTDGTGVTSWQPGAAAAGAYTNQYLLTGTTTNATETELLIAGNRVAVSNNKTSFYNIDVVARRTDAAGYAAFNLKGLANNAATNTTDQGGITEIIIYRSTGTYATDARASNATDTINIYVTGASGHTISWRAVITILEV